MKQRAGLRSLFPPIHKIRIALASAFVSDKPALARNPLTLPKCREVKMAHSNLTEESAGWNTMK
jgi:hypothetical protein